MFWPFECSSLTFEGVRRLLEKDLGLEEYALDVHKRFIKQCLLKVHLFFSIRIPNFNIVRIRKWKLLGLYSFSVVH